MSTLDSKLIKGTKPTPDELKIIENMKKAIEKSDELKQIEKEAKTYLSEEVYHRFLCSRQYKFDKALQRLKNHLKWRFEEARPHDISIDDIKEFNKLGCMQVSPRGPDKHGRPLLILQQVKMNNVLKTDDKYEKEDIKLLTYSVELTTKYFTTEAKRMVVVMNLSEQSFSKRVPLRVSRKIISIFEAQYPETLGLAVLYGAPWFYDKLYNLIKVFIDKDTKSKIIFIPANVKDGSVKDIRMKELIGDNWRNLIGIGLPRETPKSAEGYENEKYWEKIRKDGNK